MAQSCFDIGSCSCDLLNDPYNDLLFSTQTHFNYQHPIFITAAVIHTLDKHNTNTQRLYKANKILYSYLFTSSTLTQAIETYSPMDQLHTIKPIVHKALQVFMSTLPQVIKVLGSPTRHVHMCVPLASLKHAYAQCTQHNTWSMFMWSYAIYSIHITCISVPTHDVWLV